MKNLLTTLTQLLLAGASSRALNVLRKQAELAEPFHVDFRANAGGWH